MRTRVLVAVLVALGVSAIDASAQRIVFSPFDYFNDVGSRAVVAADFDGDGVMDLASASGTQNTVAILINTRKTGGGIGPLHRYTVDAGPFAMAVADINEDGKPDIVVTAADADRIDILLNNGDGTFVVSNVAAPGSPRGVAVGDINHDGHVDIVYTSFSLDTVTVLFGDGASAFPSLVTAASGRSPQGVAVADLDGDGALDLVVANTGTSPLHVFYGNGTGAFRRVDVAGAKQLFSVAIGDFDGDGRLDVAAASPAQDRVFVYLNSASGPALSKALPTPVGARGIVAADFNKDGRADIAAANRNRNEVALFAATADGTLFRPAVFFHGNTGSRALAVGDFDGDGKVDLGIGNEYTPQLTVLYNRTIIAGPGAVTFELHALPSAEPFPPTPTHALAVGDFNKNGIPDLVADDGVVLDGSSAIRVAVDRPQATYGQAVVGDFNGDSNLDFACVAHIPDGTSASGTSDAVDIFAGDGHGNFTLNSSQTYAHVQALFVGIFNGARETTLVVFAPSAGSTMVPIGLADMDRDGRLDYLFWNTDRQSVTIYRNDPRFGEVFFAESPTAGQPVSHWVITDLNEDGVPDVAGVGTDSHDLVVFLAMRDRFSTAPLAAPISSAASQVVVADFNDDGRLDYLADDGTFAEGSGDGTFHIVRQLNLTFDDAIAADVDGDGLVDVVLDGSGYAAMVLLNRGVVGPSLPPIANAGPDVTVPFQAQFVPPGVTLSAQRSFDPNLDVLSFVWRDDRGAVVGTSMTVPLQGLAPGAHMFTLAVRDDHGAEARDTVTVTITGSAEIVTYADRAAYHGAWIERSDPAAAAAIAAWDPNADAAKLNTPLASPINYVEFEVHADPTLAYKLWLRLKAEGNHFANDSVFVQFDGAVDAAGKPIYQIGSTSALAVNLEECLNCGVSGWGWRDDAWGTKGAISPVLVRFPNVGTGVVRVRVQTREDGVMLDQLVLSSKTYVTARPGAVKNDAVVLPRTEF